MSDHAAAVSERAMEARAFAQSVAGVLERAPSEPTWIPGQPVGAAGWSAVAAALGELGWFTLPGDPELVRFAGPAGVELGRRLASVELLDRLLGGAPMAADLVRSLGPERRALVAERGSPTVRRVERSEPMPAGADGLIVHRVLELGGVLPDVGEPARREAWLAACTGYLAGLGQRALELTVAYVRERRAFGTTLAALAPVQQRLADAATGVRGASLLAAEEPSGESLAHAGAAVVEACTACQQVTGAIAFTLEYPLHRYTLRARALAAWNDALLDATLSAADAPSVPAEGAGRG